MLSGLQQDSFLSLARDPGTYLHGRSPVNIPPRLFVTTSHAAPYTAKSPLLCRRFRRGGPGPMSIVRAPMAPSSVSVRRARSLSCAQRKSSAVRFAIPLIVNRQRRRTGRERVWNTTQMSGILRRVRRIRLCCRGVEKRSEGQSFDDGSRRAPRWAAAPRGRGA